MLGAYSVASATGAITATGVAGATLWACRWTSSSYYAIIERLRLNAAITGTITTAVPYDLAAYFVQNFSVVAGSAATLTGRNGARNSAFSASSMAGIYTLDTSPAGISTKTNIRSTAYKWTASVAGGTGVFYCEAVAGGDPSLAEPSAVRANDVDMTLALAVGSITAGKYWYGDGDTLGYNTVYVHLSDSADPDGKASGYLQHFVGAAFTADTQPLVRISGATGTVIGTQFFGAGMPADLIQSEIVLTANEGIVVQAPLAGPATGTFRISFSLDWREVAVI